MNKNIIIAGGGTGGHIYPALAMARSMQKKDASIQVHFVGSPRGLESKIIPKEGFPLHLVSIGMLNKNVSSIKRIKTLLLLPFAFLKSLIILVKLRPKLVLGVGGYASAPILFVASFTKIKTYIWEPNAYPGLANRLLAKRVGEALVVFDEAKHRMLAKKYKKVGMPIRESIEDIVQKSRKEGGSFKVLIFGGSQGAKGINDTVLQALSSSDSWSDGIEFVHQTGKSDFVRVQAAYDKLSETSHIQFFDYLNDMDRRYQWADLVVARAGTGTISELAACGIAAILIPYPYAADNHQKKNAEVLVQSGAAKMILQEDFTPTKFKNEILHLKTHPEDIASLAKNIKSFHSPNAADKIGEYLLENL